MERKKAFSVTQKTDINIMHSELEGSEIEIIHLVARCRSTCKNPITCDNLAISEYPHHHPFCIFRRCSETRHWNCAVSKKASYFYERNEKVWTSSHNVRPFSDFIFLFSDPLIPSERANILFHFSTLGRSSWIHRSRILRHTSALHHHKLLRFAQKQNLRKGYKFDFVDFIYTSCLHFFVPNRDKHHQIKYYYYRTANPQNVAISFAFQRTNFIFSNFWVSTIL